MLAALPFVLVLVTSRSRVLPAVIAGVAVVWGLRATGKFWRLVAARVAISAVGVLALSLFFRIVPLQQAWPFIDTNLSKYQVCHQIAWSMFRQRPLSGVGLENFRRRWFDHYDPSRHDAAFRGGAEHGRLRRNWIERNGFEVYAVISRNGGKLNVFVAASGFWRRTSALGQSRRSDCAPMTSNLPRQADSFRAGWHFAIVPIARMALTVAGGSRFRSINLGKNCSPKWNSPPAVE